MLCVGRLYLCEYDRQRSFNAPVSVWIYVICRAYAMRTIFQFPSPFDRKFFAQINLK